MPEYRLYFLDRAGHIFRATDMVCDDDGAALARMRAETHLHGLELWQQGRQVRRLPPPQTRP